MVEEHKTKEEILEAILSEREALETTLDQLSEEQKTQPGAEDGWSVKDILAHITDWEKRLLLWIDESIQGERPQRPAPGMTWDDLDRLNELTYLANKDRSLEEVEIDFHSSYQKALKTVQALSEEDLIDPKRFSWRKGDPLWLMVAANTWEHYKEHRETIIEWLQE